MFVYFFTSSSKKYSAFSSVHTYVMHHFYLRWTGHMTLYVPPSEVYKRTKCFLNTFGIYLYLETSEKPLDWHVSKDLFSKLKCFIHLGYLLRYLDFVQVVCVLRLTQTQLMTIVILSHQFSSIHGLLEPLAKLRAWSHHGPQHISSGQVADAVLLSQPRGLEGDRTVNCFS